MTISATDVQAQCDPNYLPGPTLTVNYGSCVFIVEWCYNPIPGAQHLMYGNWRGAKIRKITQTSFGSCNINWDDLRNLIMEEIYTNYNNLFQGDPLKPCDDPYNDPQDISVTTKGWRLGAGACFKSTIYNPEGFGGGNWSIFEPCVEGAAVGVCWRYYKICWETRPDGSRVAKVVEIIDRYEDSIAPTTQCPDDAIPLQHYEDLLDKLQNNPNQNCYYWCQ